MTSTVSPLPDGVREAVIKLANDHKALPWDSLNKHLMEKGFAAIHVEGKKKDVKELYQNSHNIYLQNFWAQHPDTPPQEPEADCQMMSPTTSTSNGLPESGKNMPLNLKTVNDVSNIRSSSGQS